MNLDFLENECKFDGCRGYLKAVSYVRKENKFVRNNNHACVMQSNCFSLETIFLSCCLIPND